MPLPEQPVSSSPSNDAWQTALRVSTQPGVHIVALSEDSSLDALHAMQQRESAGSEIDEHNMALSKEWVTNHRFTWLDVFANQVSTQLHSPIAGNGGMNGSSSQLVLETFQMLCSRVVNLALLRHDSTSSSAPARWSYLAQVVTGTQSQPAILRLYPPARATDFQGAMREAPFALPESFQTFCRLTNGLDLDVRGRLSINGIGPSRSDWSRVEQRDWRHCERYREMTAQWLAFQGMYRDIFAYEAQQADAAQPQLLLQRLAPLMMAASGDYWCFDVEPEVAFAEYPVVYWDHEVRDLTLSLSRTSFGEWFGACVAGTLWQPSD